MRIVKTRIERSDWQKELFASKEIPITKVVGAALADHLGNFATLQLDPSLPTLAAETGTPLRSVRRALDQLVKSKRLVRKSGKGRTRTAYQLVLCDDESGHPSAPGMAAEAQPACAPVTTQPGHTSAASVATEGIESGHPGAPNHKNQEITLGALAKFAARLPPKFWNRVSAGMEVQDGPPVVITLSHSSSLNLLRSDYGREIHELLPGFQFRVKGQAA